MTKRLRLAASAASIATLLFAQVATAEKMASLRLPAPPRDPAALAASACTAGGYSFGFFNGVQTTSQQASVALNYLKRTYGTTAANGEQIKYEVYYNYTAGFEDFVETFEQRLNEQDEVLRNRFELFFDALDGGGTFFDRVLNAIASFAQFREAFQDYVRTATVAALGRLVATPPTVANYGEHRTRIDARVLEGKKLLFYAHSQGNLFANSAFDYAVGKAGANAVRLVHVAPASPTLNGGYTLADQDLVINGLRLTGTVPANNASIPLYPTRAAGVNGAKDILGHGLLEIYLNTSLPTAGAISTNVTTALSQLQAPPAQAQDGFFTATLTWNGSGDVDLHTFEPQGAHVYYSALSGQAGFLDVDNTVANGPEHYFASCDDTQLQTGTYRIGVNPYSDSAGRTATLQISSRDGVLTTRTLVLGPDRGSSGNASPTILVTVTVARDPETGTYTASVS